MGDEQKKRVQEENKAYLRTWVWLLIGEVYYCDLADVLQELETFEISLLVDFKEVP